MNKYIIPKKQKQNKTNRHTSKQTNKKTKIINM